ncbi:MAG: tyrosine-type recombinase/integrase [Meiothermus sp.]|uniref:tyrosine-type recombinase/integrase n=1 Tax=Meiothermus sp. TaxID=1955249 RepID=UPI00261430B9|nr:tyrosine-type recombinase/integrase [Meiothermus sp.]MCS7058307.1 tyrosine-type recombinase/integrase [Meiothermus sp.]MCX7740989.1 tyrosine-type recombinase/integrase [Meiothermus sp.]MDW8481162.1 tyrosine-type recombinase/integrase [Meiothermus sp.]
MGTLVPLSAWDNPSKRRLEAIRAAQERNEEKLLELHRAYLVLKGRKRARLSPETLALYQVAIRDYLAWAWPPEAPGPKVEILKATGDDLDRWIHDLETQGGHLNPKPSPLKPGSIATYLAAVRSFYRALAWAKAAEIPQVRAPQDPTPAHERRPALPPELYQKLLLYLTYDEPQAHRDRLAVRLMGEAGLRISEVVNLRLTEVHLGERLLEVTGKGGKRRSVPISRSLAEELGRWLLLRRAHARPGEARLLINLGGRKGHGKGMTEKTLRERLNQHYRALGFPSRYHGAHLLRHTAGTRIYRKSRDLHITARLLGHANVNTSAIYAKMDMEGLFSLVDRLEEEV